MFRLVAFFTLVSCAFAASLQDNPDGRIVNGVDTTIEAHPYQVSLQTNSGGHFCGGSFINEDTIVTAAHCMQTYTASQFKVRLGSTDYRSGGELVSVKAFKFHEGYEAGSKVNDVAVVKLATPVRQSSKVRYIDLAAVNPTTGTPAVVTGWGTTCFLFCPFSPNILQEVEVNIVSEEDCASKAYKYGSQVRETMTCAYTVDKDACQGDSGGPLVANNKLVGVVSWGKGCARTGYPGVYASVASLRQWILDTAAIL